MDSMLSPSSKAMPETSFFSGTLSFLHSLLVHNVSSSVQKNKVSKNTEYPERIITYLQAPCNYSPETYTFPEQDCVVGIKCEDAKSHG
jgi:hypothetical protein